MHSLCCWAEALQLFGCASHDSLLHEANFGRGYNEYDRDGNGVENPPGGVGEDDTQ